MGIIEGIERRVVDDLPDILPYLFSIGLFVQAASPPPQLLEPNPHFSHIHICFGMLSIGSASTHYVCMNKFLVKSFN
jgi:hypothetical protein